jgi:hypothetical protein
MTDDLHRRFGIRSVANGTAQASTFDPGHYFPLIEHAERPARPVDPTLEGQQLQAGLLT